MVIQITISKRAALLMLVAVLLIVPVTAAATHVFSDVADSNIHADGIGWAADSGVTQGCGNGAFCPKQAVTREQMATFMYRLSGNDPGTDPSVVAKTADFAAVAGSAANIHYASVSESGVLAGGTAESVSRDPGGSYLVRFDADLRFCTGVASRGLNAATGGNAGEPGVDSIVWLGHPNEDIAQVFFEKDIGVYVDTGFHLMIVCP
jgi:hypothetical protein